MRYIGIDPGANLGLVCVDVSEKKRHIGSALELQWITSCRVHPGQRQDDTAAENEGRVFSQIAAKLGAWIISPDSNGTLFIAVLEEPYTHTKAWGGGRAQGTGTSFGLGKYYGLALAACTFHCHRVYSYPPTNDARRQRTGWMQGSGRIQKRELTLLALRGLAKQCGCPDPDALSEDEVMAFGVLKFHLDRYGIESD